MKYKVSYQYKKIGGWNPASKIFDATSPSDAKSQAISYVKRAKGSDYQVEVLKVEEV